MDEYNGRISLLIDERGLTVEVYDEASGECVVDLELPPKETCQALGRLVHIPCKVRYGELDRVGKKMETDYIVFPIPKHDYNDRNRVATEACAQYCPEGWIADNYYGSQGSFFEKEDQQYARCTVRRWVTP